MFCFSHLEVCLTLLPCRPVVFWSICCIRFCWLDVSKPVWPSCQLRFKGEENPHHGGQAWILWLAFQGTAGAPASLGVWQIQCLGREFGQQWPPLGGLVVWVPHGGKTLSVPPTASGPVGCPAQPHPHSWPLSTAVRGPFPSSATSSHNIVVWFLYLTLSTLLHVVPAPFSSTLLPLSPPPHVPGNLQPHWTSPTPFLPLCLPLHPHRCSSLSELCPPLQSLLWPLSGTGILSISGTLYLCRGVRKYD